LRTIWAEVKFKTIQRAKHSEKQDNLKLKHITKNRKHHIINKIFISHAKKEKVITIKKKN
jgi:hypothetical protein